MNEYIRFFKQAFEDRNILVDEGYFKRLYSSERPENLFMSPASFQFASRLHSKSEVCSNVSTSALIRDIEFLEEELSQVYGGYSFFSERGLSWPVFFQEWKDSIAKEKGSSVDCGFGLSPLHRGPNSFIDNHLQFPFLGLSKSKKSQTVLAECLGHQLRVSSVKIYAGQEIASSIVTVGPQEFFREKANLADSKEHKRLIDQFGPSERLHLFSTSEFTYLRVPTFSASVEVEARNFKNSSNSFEGPLIVDIRSNAGFSNMTLISIINELSKVNEACEYQSYFSLELIENARTSCLADNFDLFSLLLHKNDHTPLDLRERIAENLSEKPIEPCAKRVIANDRMVYVLSNRFVSSDGEALLHYLKCFKNICVIGENTAGTCEFVQPGLLFLPSTELPMFVPKGRNLAGESQGIDGYGISPDIYVSADGWDRSSILDCIKYIESRGHEL